ncbi:MAG: glycosyl hydrolase [Acidobacteria bacterium]|nr:glycosyl hydrolase [Acidobacteriota bacterium]
MALSTTPRLLVGTKKGAWMLQADGARRRWNISAPICFGTSVFHIVQDPREPKRMVLSSKAGHLGPTVMVSKDGGKKWTEAKRPPAFPEGLARKSHSGVDEPRTVDHVFWLQPGHASEKGVWYAGTSPQGLFRSEDHGDTWQSVDGFNQHEKWSDWCGMKEDSPPDGARLHSINVDPRDARHLYIGMSAGGVFESCDGGATWTPLNKGCSAEFLPSPDAEYGHDPHCVRLHPLMPDRLYQQNHCGIYRMERGAGVWERIGMKMPKKVGDIGFPVVLHPRDPDTCWVFPMDGTSVWPRTSPEGKPAVYRTSNAGKSWQRQDKGMPDSNAWWTVFRQAMTADTEKRVGLYFGTTQGAVWASRDEGESWKAIAEGLPRIQSVEAAYL